MLLPAYLCKEVLRPFAGRSRILFYDVGDDLSVDPDVMKRLLERERVRLLLIINYFGFLQPWRQEIARLCTERETVLLEDCAHSLLTQGSGETGRPVRRQLPQAPASLRRGRAQDQEMPRQGSPSRTTRVLYSNVLSLLATGQGAHALPQ